MVAGRAELHGSGQAEGGQRRGEKCVKGLMDQRREEDEEAEGKGPERTGGKSAGEQIRQRWRWWAVGLGAGQMENRGDHETDSGHIKDRQDNV